MVLKMDRVGTRDNFFDLGGNSLKILHVNHRLTEALGIKIPVVDLFKYPTITSLKEYLKQQTGRMGFGEALPAIRSSWILIPGCPIGWKMKRAIKLISCHII